MKVYKISNNIDSVYIAARRLDEALYLAKETDFEDEEDILIINAVPSSQMITIIEEGGMVDRDGNYHDKKRTLSAQDWAEECETISNEEPVILASTLY